MVDDFCEFFDAQLKNIVQVKCSSTDAFMTSS